MWFSLAEEAWRVYVVTHLTCSSSQALQALFQPLQRGQSIKVKEIMTEEVTPVTPSPSPPPTSHLHNPIFLSSPLLTPPSLSPPSTHCTLSSPSHIHPTLPTTPYSSPHSSLPPHALTLSSPSTHTHTPLPPHTLTPSHPSLSSTHASKFACPFKLALLVAHIRT